MLLPLSIYYPHVVAISLVIDQCKIFVQFGKFVQPSLRQTTVENVAVETVD